MLSDYAPLDDLHGRKVLVIEDSRFFQNAMQRGIARLLPNCTIAVATTLAEGLAAIAADRDGIFLVLLDLNLPDSRGAATVAPVTAASCRSSPSPAASTPGCARSCWPPRSWTMSPRTAPRAWTTCSGWSAGCT